MTDATDTTKGTEYIGNDRKARMGREARKVLALCINAAPGGQRAVASADRLAHFGLDFAIDALNHCYRGLSELGKRNADEALKVLQRQRKYATSYYVGQGVAYQGEHGWFVSSINMAKGESLAPGSKVASLTITNRSTAPWGEVTLTHAELDAALEGN